ncbi:MAG: hypothetical protein HS115_05955 [Spirochaetales bacterium]|nr:hypothetical protein [Spirochaetales bacterium]
MREILFLFVTLMFLLACPKKSDDAGVDMKPELSPAISEENAIDEADRIIEELDSL